MLPGRASPSGAVTSAGLFFRANSKKEVSEGLADLLTHPAAVHTAPQPQNQSFQFAQPIFRWGLYVRARRRHVCTCLPAPGIDKSGQSANVKGGWRASMKAWRVCARVCTDAINQRCRARWRMEVREAQVRQRESLGRSSHCYIRVEPRPALRLLTG